MPTTLLTEPYYGNDFTDDYPDTRILAPNDIPNDIADPLTVEREQL